MQPNNQEQENWAFHNESEQQAAQQPLDQTVPQSNPTVSHEPISWTGSEFMSQHKNTGWYLGLAGFIAAACVIVFIISKGDYLSVIFIAIMGILFGIIASKKPRQLQYSVDTNGITIGQRHYPFQMFKSFSVQRDGAIGFINLLPLGRLQPELSIYFPPEDEDRIFETLSSFLPHEQRTESRVDKMVKQIRF